MMQAKKDVDVLVVGAGQGGTAVLQVFSRCSWMNILGIVDRDQDSAGMILARTMGIETSTDLEKSICNFYGDLIVDVTGRQYTYQKISALRTHNSIEIISGKATRLLFDLASHQIDDQSVIDAQTLRLQLLNSMLDISLNLEENQNLGSDNNVCTAHKAIAIMIEKDHCTVAGIMGDQSKPLDESLAAKLKKTFSDNYIQQQLPENSLFIELPEDFYLEGLDTYYTLAIPLHREGDDELLGVLFFYTPLPMASEKVKMINIIVKHLYLSVKTLFYYQSLEYHAIRDPLTDIYNRRYFEKRLTEELSRLNRQEDMVFFCLFFDLDHFKQINDVYGHQAGDLSLIMVATCVGNILRDYDIFARYGGDEFVAVLPMKENHKKSIHVVAKRILLGVRALRIAKYPDLRIGTSIGVSCIYPSENLNANEVVDRADRALYQAKDAGRGVACLQDNGEQKIITV
ncbi:MAG: GGDEF domain-containing protein [Mariprofundaceae bacterium]|nr:GGDEF domain-containing protein [Mariprofundaceae bacterium]